MSRRHCARYNYWQGVDSLCFQLLRCFDYIASTDNKNGHLPLYDLECLEDREARVIPIKASLCVCAVAMSVASSNIMGTSMPTLYWQPVVCMSAFLYICRHIVLKLYS